MRRLIEANNHLTKDTDENGRTPLHYAAHWGGRSVAKLLLEKDASAAYKTDKEGCRLFIWQHGKAKDILSYCPGCWGIVDKRGWNFLHFLVVTLPPKDVKRFLLGNVVKDIPISIILDAKDVNGYTPLHVMVAGLASPYDYFKFVSLLRDQYGFNVREYITEAFFYGNAKEKKHIRELLKEIGNNAEVAGIPVDYSFRENVEEHVEDENFHKIVDKAKETHLLVATLITTVTFTAAFTVPGGYKSDEQGTATLSRDSAFQAFIITNTLAFVSSLLAIFIQFLTWKTGMAKVWQQIDVFFSADYSTFFAMTEMVIAFSTGSYAVLEYSNLGFAITSCSLGLAFFPGLLIAFFFSMRLS
ncbi:hypothetical protein REPUB_Repub20aG0036100 [Reevesia pubescens]